MYKTYANFNVTNSIFVLYSTLLPSRFNRKILTLFCFTAFKINYKKNVLQFKGEALIRNKPLVSGPGFRWKMNNSHADSFFLTLHKNPKVIKAGNRSSTPHFICTLTVD